MLFEKKKYIEIQPDKALNWSMKKTFSELKSVLGKQIFEKACDITVLYPSPISKEKDTSWIKNAKIIGINPRIAGTYFNIIKYAMTFPEDAIHIMPLWNAGCDGSIYARVNWDLSEEWLDEDLCKSGYSTPKMQLKFVTNMLHALGKKVGFDAVPHTDKFSEEVFIFPECFEWIKLNEEKTKQLKFSNTNDIYKELNFCILNFLKQNGCADGQKFNFEQDTDISRLNYDEKSLILFGKDKKLKHKRRIMLMDYVREQGFETIPVTEHIPLKPVVFEGIKGNGKESYASFSVPQKSSAAKIFNAITPYRWYETDQNGYPIIEKPVSKTFEHFNKMVSNFQQEYNFDFLRADMAHNQISHSHSKDTKNPEFNDEMWKNLKQHIKEKVPYFATFAESFFNTYYIDGFSDMKNKDFDIVLGNSNFLYLNNTFTKTLKLYNKISKDYQFSPCIASITNDSDTEQNNKYHKSPLANELRYFCELFVSLPGYTGMGFELRNLTPNSKEEYSGIFTNHQQSEYKWGQNKKLFNAISKMRRFYTKISLPKTYTVFSETDEDLVWINFDKNTKKPLYLFVINIDTKTASKDIHFEFQKEFLSENYLMKPVFSLNKSLIFLNKTRSSSNSGLIRNIDFGDARIYRLI